MGASEGDQLLTDEVDIQGPIILVDIGDLGIDVEGPASSESELRGSLSRSHVLSDYTVNAVNVNPDTGNIRVKQARLSGKIVEQALVNYQGVLTRQPGDAITILEENQTGAMSNSIQEAWTKYSSSAGSDASGSGFRTWLDSSAGDSKARGYVNGLGSVYKSLEASGLNATELNFSRTTTMQRILKSGSTQSDMTPAELSSAMGS